MRLSRQHWRGPKAGWTPESEGHWEVEVAGPNWLELAVPIGDHDPVAVARALGFLAAEGLVERHPDSEFRARLPLG